MAACLEHNVDGYQLRRYLYFISSPAQTAAHPQPTCRTHLLGNRKGGCDTVLSTKASKFFGLFGWSEVGFAYFSVSLVALLVFPVIPHRWLSSTHVAFPSPSGAYGIRKSVPRHGVRYACASKSLLWLSFFCYLWGRSFHGYDSFGNIAVLGACYTVMLLGVNRLLPLFDRSPDEERESPEEQISQ